MAKKQNSDSDMYVQLNHSDSVNAKRNLLEMTGSLISLQLISGKLAKLGKEEVSRRNGEKKQLKMAISEINRLVESMPNIKIEKPKERAEPKKKEIREKVEKEVPKKVEKKTLKDELDEVKKKIEGLKN